MAASVALGVLLSAGGSCALRGTAERPGVEAGRPAAEPEEQNVALWRAASAGCLEADRRWVKQISEGVLIAWCDAPTLGVVSVPRPKRRTSPSVATVKLQERAPEERVGSGQVDTESAAQDGSGVRTTAGARPASSEEP